MANDPHSKRLMWFVFGGSRGGGTRLRILRIIRERPSNANQLAGELGMDYKAVQHHMRVLEKNNMVAKEGERYGVVYFFSAFLEANADAFDEVAEKLGAAEKERGKGKGRGEA